MNKPTTSRAARGDDKLAAHLRASLPADARAVDVLAFEILALRRDLLPSVERIMNTSGEVETAERALVLFRDSLSIAGDPNRDPRVAIANAQATTGAATES
ncbi:MAG: hypothetical protein F2534_20910 [Actinobacteria bacterium]|jgi:hypothetical protein|uniref:Unannotated protein n=1 Tax=freshwater metagenome TaxID=449393 RepID=A0A6J6GB59_9ZZZZ|nr:hypothetical protein [Actinomycetota bacterium]